MVTLNSKTKWLDEMAGRTLDKIEGYRQRGWPVFPVGKNKAPMTPHGCLDASTDANTIQRWWADSPTANVAIATGRKSKLVVIDVDNKNGVDGVASLRAEFGSHFNVDTDNQPIVFTPTGGLHLYYRWDDMVPATVAVGVLPGVDIRGEGGYVVAPPSSMKIGDHWCDYEWHNAASPIPLLPDWAFLLLDQTLKPATISAPQAMKSSPLNVPQVIAGISSGQRDDQLFRYACHLRGLDVPRDIALGFICEAAARCVPPFSESVAIAKVDRAYQNLDFDNFL